MGNSEILYYDYVYSLHIIYVILSCVPYVLFYTL